MPEPLDLIVRERRVLKEAFTWRGISKRQRFDEYAKIERTLIQQFLKSKSAADSPSTVEVDGFVSRMGDRKFFLRPTMAYNDGIVCNANQLRRMPTEHEFVHVKGNRILSRSGMTLASANKLDVTDCEVVRLPTDELKPELSFKDAAEMLISPIIDSPPYLARNLLLSLTSSPGELRREGGLTAALMPQTGMYSEANYWLLKELQNFMPGDLTGDKRLRVQVEGAGAFFISPFPWNIHNTSESAWDPVKDTRIMLRTTNGPTLQETTIGFAAASVAPKSLDEIWIKQADFPTLTGNELKTKGRGGGFDLRLALYFISVHMNRPKIEAQDDAEFLRLINKGLLKLKHDYGSNYGDLVTFDQTSGSARSVESIARAMARVDGKDVVKEEHIRDALSEYIDARDAVFRVWADLGKAFGSGVPVPTKARKIGPLALKIYLYLRDHPDTSVTELRERYSVSDQIFNQDMDKLEAQGCIYATSYEDQRYSAV